MAYLNTTTNQYPVYEQDIRQAYPNTSFSTPFTPPEEYVVVFSVPMPTFDSYLQTCIEDTPVLTNKGHYEQVYKLTDLVGEALEEGLARKAADIAVREEAAEKVRVSTLWQEATKYEQSFISNSALALLPVGMMQSKPKTLEVIAWINEIWNGENGYYARIASKSTDYDFSFAGAMPYTVPELSAEVLGG